MLYLLILFFLFLLSRPLSSTFDNDLIKILPVVLLVMGVVQYSVKSRFKVYKGKIFNKLNFIILLTFHILFCLSFLRGSSGDSGIAGKLVYVLQYTSLLLFAYYFFMNNTLRHDINFVKNGIFYLIVSMSLFLIVELVLFTAGINSSHGGSQALLASMVGLNVNRSGFLLGGTHNNFGLFIGSTLVMSAFYLFFLNPKQIHKIILVFITLIATFLLLVSDVRGVAFSIFITFALVYLLRKFSGIKLIPWLALVPLIITLSIPLIQELLMTLGSDAIAQISRRNNDFLTFNNRTNIWLGVREGLSSFSLNHLFGYGQAGHLTSDLYKYWLDVQPFVVTHNIYYQLITDMGYTGLVVFLILIFRSLKDAVQLYLVGYQEAIVLIGFIIYFILASMFESSIGIYNHLQTSAFLLFVFLPILLKNVNQYYFFRIRNSESLKSRLGAT